MQPIAIYDVTDDFGDVLVTLGDVDAVTVWIAAAAASRPRSFMVQHGDQLSNLTLGDGLVVGLEVDLSGCGQGPHTRLTEGDDPGAEVTRHAYGVAQQISGDQIVPVARALPVLVALFTAGARLGSWDGDRTAPALAIAPTGLVGQLCRALERTPAAEHRDVLALVAHAAIAPAVVAYLRAYGSHQGVAIEIADFIATRPTLVGGRVCLGAVVDGAVMLAPDGGVEVTPLGERHRSFEAFLEAQVRRSGRALDLDRAR